MNESDKTDDAPITLMAPPYHVQQRIQRAYTETHADSIPAVEAADEHYDIAVIQRFADDISQVCEFLVHCMSDEEKINALLSKPFIMQNIFTHDELLDCAFDLIASHYEIEHELACCVDEEETEYYMSENAQEIDIFMRRALDFFSDARFQTPLTPYAPKQTSATLPLSPLPKALASTASIAIGGGTVEFYAECLRNLTRQHLRSHGYSSQYEPTEAEWTAAFHNAGQYTALRALLTDNPLTDNETKQLASALKFPHLIDRFHSNPATSADILPFGESARRLSTTQSTQKT